MAFFLSNDIINYCYHAMGEHVAVRGVITHYEENDFNLQHVVVQKQERNVQKSVMHV